MQGYNLVPVASEYVQWYDVTKVLFFVSFIGGAELSGLCEGGSG